MSNLKEMTRRKFLISSLVSIAGISTIGVFLSQQHSQNFHQEYDEIVSCNGWIMKRGDIKYDVCEPRVI